MLKKLWLDEGGAILSFELMLIMVILVIGISVGMVVLRDAIVSTYQRVASAVDSLDPGYGWSELVYTGNTSGAVVVENVADVTECGWDVGTGQIYNDVDGAPITVNLLAGSEVQFSP